MKKLMLWAALSVFLASEEVCSDSRFTNIERYGRTVRLYGTLETNNVSYVSVEISTNLINWEENLALNPILAEGQFCLPFVRFPGYDNMVFFRLQNHPYPTLTVSEYAAGSTYQTAAAGSTAVTTTTVKFRATHEDVLLKQIALNLTSGTPQDISQITLWDGPVQVGTAIFTGTNLWAVSVLPLSPCCPSYVLIQKDIDKVITVKADLAPIGVAQPVTESGHLVAIDVDSSKEMPGRETKGVSPWSGVTVNAVGKTGTYGVRVYKGYPVLSKESSSDSLVEGDQDLLVFSVLAVGGDVQLGQLAFTILKSTTVTVNSLRLIGPNGSVGFVAMAKSPMNSAATIVTARFNSESNTEERIIPAGQKRTFKLQGLVTGSREGELIVFFNPDANYRSATMSGLEAMTDVNPADWEPGVHIIWSPNSTAISSPGDSDWFDGYHLSDTLYNDLVNLVH